MTPEFSRIERAETIGEVPRPFHIIADADERRRVAGRFGLIAVDRLEADITLHRDEQGVIASGCVSAEVTQGCSVTGDPVPARITEPIALRFTEPAEHGDEIELGEETIDTIEIEDGAIDLGEAAAETLALALDPYPRSPAAQAVLREAGVVSEDEVALGAFGGLAALRDRLKG